VSARKVFILKTPKEKKQFLTSDTCKTLLRRGELLALFRGDVYQIHPQKLRNKIIPGLCILPKHNPEDRKTWEKLKKQLTQKVLNYLSNRSMVPGKPA